MKGVIPMDEYMHKLDIFTRRSEIQTMKMFSQHKTSNTFEHVCHVARMCHKLEQKLRLKNIDQDALIRGAVLHDFYLYDFRQHPIGAYAHGTTHASTALENAEQLFDLNDTEKDIIYSHMWPLNLSRIPRTKEAWIVSIADKICAVEEMYLARIRRLFRRTA